MQERVEIISGEFSVTPIGDGNKVRNEHDIVVMVDNRTTFIPAGRVSDLSTLTAFGRPFFHWTQVALAGLLHDEWLRFAEHGKKISDFYRYNRWWAVVAKSGKFGRRANPLSADIAGALLNVLALPIWIKRRLADNV